MSIQPIQTNSLNRRQFLLGLSLSLSFLSACSRTKKHARLSSSSVVLALGDSLTAGYGASKGDDYPSQLAQITGWRVINGGISGDTSEQALKRLPELLAQNPDIKLVIVSIGGNDFLQKKPESTTRNNINQIIKTIKNHNVNGNGSKIEIVLVAIPYFTAGALIGSVSEHPLYDDLAKENDVPLLKGAWADVLGDKSMKSDQVHGNSQGYRYFAEELADFLKKQGFR